MKPFCKECSGTVLSRASCMPVTVRSGPCKYYNTSSLKPFEAVVALVFFCQLYCILWNNYKMMCLGNFEPKFVEKWLCYLNIGNNLSYFVNLFSGRCVTDQMEIFNVLYSEKYGEFYGVCVIQIGFLHVALSPCKCSLRIDFLDYKLISLQ